MDEEDQTESPQVSEFDDLDPALQEAVENGDIDIEEAMESL